jgi:lysozyme family protein
MASFNSFINTITDKFEGGYQNFANDNGNYIQVNGKKVNIGTNHGIAGVTLAEYNRMKGKPVPTAQDVKSLTKAQAINIYKELFWDKYYFSDIKYQGIAEFIFDMSLGSAYFIKWVNRALNELTGSKLPTSNTYTFGKTQIDIINKYPDPKKLLDVIKKYRLAWYDAIVKADSSQAMFLKSWQNRTEALYNKWKNNISEFIDETTQEVKKNPVKSSIVLVFIVLIGAFLIYKYGFKKYAVISATTPII